MADKKDTFIILSPGFPESEADTTCLPAHQVFVRALHKNFPGLNIIILAFQYPFIAHEYEWNGVKVISFNIGDKRKFSKLLVWYKIWQTLKWLNKTHNIKGLLSFWVTDCALIGKRFAKRHNLQHYAWITGQDAKSDNKRIKEIKPAANEVFAMSDFLARQFNNNHYVMPATVIPNGIDTELFDKEPKVRSIDILAAGSLIPLKQYDVFIEVVKLIHNKMPQVKAVQCGKGPLLQQLKGMVRQYEIQDSLTLAGEKAHIEVLGLMQQSRIFLHTSNYEGFSTVCLEALYAGAHVISFFRPMEHDIEHWHIVDTKEAMAAKALELLSAPSTQYTPVLAYKMDDVARQVMGLYK